jgi:flavin reductase (DIM6/NTAB) family NADH-FMN oxidoreductase RutF
MTDLVWSDTLLDCNARYECTVVRVGDDGRLTITLLGNVDHVLHHERVNVDRADASKWRSHCETVIHDPDLRSVDP